MGDVDRKELFFSLGCRSCQELLGERKRATATYSTKRSHLLTQLGADVVRHRLKVEYDLGEPSAMMSCPGFNVFLFLVIVSIERLNSWLGRPLADNLASGWPRSEALALGCTAIVDNLLL